MFLIIGLGNPGIKFKSTRHNSGFLALDLIRKKDDLSSFKNSSKFFSEITNGIIEGKKVLLAKPKTFMNNSGKAVKTIASFYKIPVKNIWAIHDDLAIEPGNIKISKSRGSAGHNGIESIISEIGSKNFIRFRIGIKPEVGAKTSLRDLVLQEFTKEEKKLVKKAITRVYEALHFSLSQGIEKAMNKFNKKE